TTDDESADRARMLRVHGARQKYYHEMVGYNSRLDEMQAAVLRVKLPHIDEWNEARRQAAKCYNELLKDVPGIITPYEAPYVKHVYHQYTIRILDGKRDKVKQFLAEQGIGTMIYYPVPVHKLPVYANSNCHLPEAERAAGEVLSLPIWPEIAEETQVHIARVMEEALA
ncbi:MAG: DegT/DnrJ/EryC1/StrS family aminotransferase, partial [Clostridia bacterium]|nr:DegT/DnrJ/EryC1/StrS family aminotransferase [Clostridia bacterium]